jgi:hydroxyacylglutathione hydrolase
MPVRFFERPYPNANAILLQGPRPVLVDPGAGHDVPALLAWLDGAAPAWIVNTHWHTDHSGANYAMQARGIPIAASAPEADAVNARAPDACRARWLDQLIEPYEVARALHPGDVVETGASRWQVIALPGHTAMQIGLWCADDRVLVAGDALHDADLGWLDLDADPAALDQAEATVGLIDALAPRLVLSGHGPAIADPPAAIERARRRLAAWRQKPDRIAWHACKRIFTHGLMLEGGVARDRLLPLLLASQWLQDHAHRAFGLAPEAFAPLLLNEMLRSGAALWQADRLLPGGDYVAVGAGWPAGPGGVADWPAVRGVV